MEDAKQERVRNIRDAKERRIEKAWGRKEGFLIFSLRVLLCLHVHNSIFLSFRFKIRAFLAKENSRTFSGGQPIFRLNYTLYSFVHIIIQQFCLSVRFKGDFSFFKEWLFFWKTSGNEIKMSLLFCQHQREIQQTSLQPKQTSDRK